VLRSLTAFLCSIDHTQQKRAARSGSSAHHFTSYQSACAASSRTARISRNLSCAVLTYGWWRSC
jgi:hypothetical protein